MICWFILWFTNQKTSVRTLTVSLHRPCWTNISDFLLLEDLIWLDIISLCFLFVGSRMRPRTFCPLAPRRPGSPGFPAAPGPPCRESNRKEGLKIVTGFLYVSGYLWPPGGSPGGNRWEMKVKVIILRRCRSFLYLCSILCLFFVEHLKHGQQWNIEL